MEAVAKHDFQPTEADELPFRRGDKIKVLDIESSDWYQAEKNGKTGMVPASYLQMKPHPWYLGKIGRKDAEPILLEKKSGHYRYEDGAFIVRRSESDPYGFSLSVKNGNCVQHFKILYNEAGKYNLWSEYFDSITDLIETHKQKSVSRHSHLLLKELESCDSERAIYAKALYDFKAGSSEEMSFRKGDRMLVTDRSDQDWFKAELNGKSGLVPANYINVES